MGEGDDDGGLVQRIVARIDRFQRAHPWAALPWGVAKKFGEDQAGNLAALIAYYAFFSIFPLLLALVTILGFVLAGNETLQKQILDTALANFPVIGDQLRENVGTLNTSGWALAIGLVGLLWAGLGAVEAAEHAMNSVWDVPLMRRPGFLPRKLRGLILLVVLGVGLIATTLLASVSTTLGDLGAWVRFAGIFATFLLNVALFLLAFKVLTHVPARWTTFLPGSIIGALAWMVLQAFGGYLVADRVTNASDTYGTFAIVIGLLSWIYLQAQITLFAAEVNVVRARRLWPRALTNENLTEADRRALERYAKETRRIPPEEVEVDVRGEGVARR